MVPTIHPKVAAGGLAAGIVTVLMWVLVAYVPHFNPPPDVVAAFAGIVYVAVGWLTPSGN